MRVSKSPKSRWRSDKNGIKENIWRKEERGIKGKAKKWNKHNNKKEEMDGRPRRLRVCVSAPHNIHANQVPSVNETKKPGYLDTRDYISHRRRGPSLLPRFIGIRPP